MSPSRALARFNENRMEASPSFFLWLRMLVVNDGPVTVLVLMVSSASLIRIFNESEAHHWLGSL